MKAVAAKSDDENLQNHSDSTASEGRGQTYSVCPICLKRLKACRVPRDGAIYIERECPEHGRFSTVIWRDFLSLNEWVGVTAPIADGENLNCPHACGICADHRRNTCCVLLEVTSRCNMSCSFCFAESDDVNQRSADPTLSDISHQISSFVHPGETLLQLSCGEPTVRDDLPEIVAEAKRLGCKYIQLNSNGIRLAEDEAFVQRLSEAGLSFVFMQFDGTDDSIYELLRGRLLFEIKRRAIENCAKHGIGVTLVPTIVRGVNLHNIPDILDFAVSHSPAVRGVHFQPVCFMGRFPQQPCDEERVTLDELIYIISKEWRALPQDAKLEPSCCDHPLCGFHSDFVTLRGGELYPLNRGAAAPCCPDSDPSKKNREFVARRWQRDRLATQSDKAALCTESALCEPTAEAPETSLDGSTDCCCDINDLDYFVRRVKSHGFTITAMAFQDAWNLDLERLRSCSLHVYQDGVLKPFCSRYLTAGAVTDESADSHGSLSKGLHH